jgi:hypothetical protein
MVMVEPLAALTVAPAGIIVAVTLVAELARALADMVTV